MHQNLIKVGCTYLYSYGLRLSSDKCSQIYWATRSLYLARGKKNGISNLITYSTFTSSLLFLFFFLFHHRNRKLKIMAVVDLLHNRHQPGTHLGGGGVQLPPCSDTLVGATPGIQGFQSPPPPPHCSDPLAGATQAGIYCLVGSNRHS